MKLFLLLLSLFWCLPANALEIKFEDGDRFIVDDQDYTKNLFIVIYDQIYFDKQQSIFIKSTESARCDIKEIRSSMIKIYDKNDNFLSNVSRDSIFTVRPNTKLETVLNTVCQLRDRDAFADRY